MEDVIYMWLDDIREAPYGYDWAKSYDEAVALLETGKVVFASLDHDLTFDGDGKTGYDVVCWMEENIIWPEQGIVCHSMNPSGRKRIEQVIERMKEWKYGR